MVSNHCSLTTLVIRSDHLNFQRFVFTRILETSGINFCSVSACSSNCIGELLKFELTTGNIAIVLFCQWIISTRMGVSSIEHSLFACLFIWALINDTRSCGRLGTFRSAEERTIAGNPLSQLISLYEVHIIIRLEGNKSEPNDDLRKNKRH